MAKTNRLLAMIDGSLYSDSVCGHAAWVASKLNFGVDVIHVIGRRGAGTDASNLSGNIGLGARTTLLEELSEHDTQMAKLAHKRGRLILEDAAALIGQAGVSDVQTRMRNGEIVETVLASESSVDLIIMGKRGEGADFDKMHPGSNLERVARSCTKPILVASRKYEPIQRVLIAYDGGKSSRKALEHVAKSQLLKGLPIKLLMVSDNDSTAKQTLEQGTTLLQDGGFTVTSECVSGVPETVISKDVDQNDHGLLVMGAYGHTRIRSLILGSTTTAMISSCKIPVMLFR